MSILKGPSDADHFRVKKGRFGSRFYTDPLPACEIAPASDWCGPSVSTTKPPFANKYVPMRSIADMPDTEWVRLANLDPDARYEAIKAYEKVAGRVNMDRGNIIHELAEAKLLGDDFRKPGSYSAAATEAAEQFKPALEAFFDTYQPELVAAEVVCLHRTLNGVGYGGTADAFVRIEGDVWAVDWKSRNSDHGAYLEEAAQGGAYIGAEYMIVTGPDGSPVRARIPDVAGVLIVSIRHDGFKAYPIDAAGAVDAYAEMHRWWTAQRRVVDNEVIGHPWGPKATRVKADRRERLRGRYQLLNNEDQLRFVAIGADPDDLDAVEAALNQVDPFMQSVEPRPFVAVTAAPPAAVPLDEGPPATADEIQTLRTAWEFLEPGQAEWVRQVVAAAGNLSVDQNPSQRRVAIGTALVQLAVAGWGDEDVVGACLEYATDGHVNALAELPAHGAERFSIAVDSLIAERLTIAFDDGRTVIVEANTNQPQEKATQAA